MACPRLRSATSQTPLLVAASLISAMVRLLRSTTPDGFWLNVGIYQIYASSGELEALLTWTFTRMSAALLPVFLFPYLVGGSGHYPTIPLSMAVFRVIAMLLVLFQSANAQPHNQQPPRLAAALGARTERTLHTPPYLPQAQPCATGHIRFDCRVCRLLVGDDKCGRSYSCVVGAFLNWLRGQQ